MTSIHDIEIETIDGNAAPLGDYRDRVLLIVNTASECGFTPQFEGLQRLHEEYQQKGLQVLGFPCNQFGKQDPGSNPEILSFCESHYGVTFPMHARIDVNGDNAHPVFRFLTAQKRGVLGSRRIKWNFTKFLVDTTGQVVGRFSPMTKPEKLKVTLERLLSAS